MNAARQQKRQALIERYRIVFTGISQGHDSSRIKHLQAVDPWCVMFRAKSKARYLEFSPKELGCDEVLMALGLAKSGPQGVEYANFHALLV